jgi:hypothetical protein
MKKRRQLVFLFIFFLAIFLGGVKVQGQVFWLGFNGGATYSWFSSSDAENFISSDGYGWNLGFFARYGKRPFYKLGFHWTHANQNMKVNFTDNSVIEDKVPFHNFDLQAKVGYEIIQKAIFKWHINGGAFLGRALLESTNTFEIEKSDLNIPQYGIAAGTGIQYMNFIIDLDYQYHISELFKGEEDELGFNLGSHLQHLSLKIGFQF